MSKKKEQEEVLGKLSGVLKEIDEITESKNNGWLARISNSKNIENMCVNIHPYTYAVLTVELKSSGGLFEVSISASGEARHNPRDAVNDTIALQVAIGRALKELAERVIDAIACNLEDNIKKAYIG